MKDLMQGFALGAFYQNDLHRVANAAYNSMLHGNTYSLEALSRYLANRGFIVVTQGFTVTARAAASRAEFPESIVFTLSGSGPLHYSEVARICHVSTWCMGYYMDEESMREMARRKEADNVERASEAASDRSEQEDNLLRD